MASCVGLTSRLTLVSFLVIPRSHRQCHAFKDKHRREMAPCRCCLALNVGFFLVGRRPHNTPVGGVCMTSPWLEGVDMTVKGLLLHAL